MTRKTTTIPAVAIHTAIQMARERVTDERPSGHDLVGEGERKGEVEVEVDDPPGLVFEVAPGDSDRSDPSQDHEAETDGSGQKIGIGGEEVPELAEWPSLRQLGVAEGDEDDMGPDEPQRPWRDPAVPAN